MLTLTDPMSQYEEVDRRILVAIEQKKNPIYAREVDQEAQRLGEATGRKAYRVVDGRLQALRRKGRIEHLGKAQAPGSGGWRVVQAQD